MKRQWHRLNWVRVTRDPAVAAAYEQSAEASAAWTEALRQALRGPADAAPIPFPAVPAKSVQCPLPLGDNAPTAPGRRIA
jgi:hypothetical protein